MFLSKNCDPEATNVVVEIPEPWKASFEDEIEMHELNIEVNPVESCNPPYTYKYEGNRITDISHFFSELGNFPHLPLVCGEKILKLINEIRNGLESKFQLQFNMMCNTVDEINTVRGWKKKMNLNTAAVVGSKT